MSSCKLIIEELKSIMNEMEVEKVEKKLYGAAYGYVFSWQLFISRGIKCSNFLSSSSKKKSKVSNFAVSCVLLRDRFGQIVLRDRVLRQNSKYCTTISRCL